MCVLWMKCVRDYHGLLHGHDLLFMDLPDAASMALQCISQSATRLKRCKTEEMIVI